MAIGAKLLAAHVLSIAEGRIHVAHVDVRRACEVCAVGRVNQRRVLQSGIDGGDGGQRLVIDLNQVQGILGYVPALRNHHGHGLASVAHGVGGERPLQIVVQPRQGKDAHGDRFEQLRHVRVGKHGRDTLESQRCRGVYATNVGVRVRTSQYGGVQHPRQADVIQILPGSSDEADVLPAANGLPDVRQTNRLTGHFRSIHPVVAWKLGRNVELKKELAQAGWQNRTEG